MIDQRNQETVAGAADVLARVIDVALKQGPDAQAIWKDALRTWSTLLKVLLVRPFTASVSDSPVKQDAPVAVERCPRPALYKLLNILGQCVPVDTDSLGHETRTSLVNNTLPVLRRLSVCAGRAFVEHQALILQRLMELNDRQLARDPPVPFALVLGQPLFELFADLAFGNERCQAQLRKAMPLRYIINTVRAGPESRELSLADVKAAYPMPDRSAALVSQLPDASVFPADDEDALRPEAVLSLWRVLQVRELRW